MARFLNSGRGFGFTFLLAAMGLTAQQPFNFDARLRDGIAAIRAGHSEQAVELLRALPEQAQAFSPNDVRRVETTLVLAAAYQYGSQLDAAEPLYLEAIHWLKAREEKGGWMLAVALDNLGRLRLQQGRWQSAEELLGQARDLYTQTRNAGDTRIANVNRLLGEAYLGQGQIVAGAALIKRSVEMLRQAPDAAAATLAAALRSLATAYTVLGRYLEAEASLEEAIQLTRASGPSELELADGLLGLGHLCLLQRDTARAMPLLQKAMRIFEINQDSHLAGALSELGAAALQDGKFAMAKAYLVRALDIDRTLFEWDHVSIALVQAALAEAYFGERNYAQAGEMIRQAIAADRTSVGDEHFSLAGLLLVEAAIEARQHRPSEADGHYRQALDIYRKNFPTGHPELVKAQHEYALFTKSFRK